MKLNFSTFLNEGMIKLPQKMLRDGQSKIVSDLCSYALTEVQSLDKDDPSVKKFIEHVKSAASKYSAPLRHLKKKTFSRFTQELEKRHS